MAGQLAAILTDTTYPSSIRNDFEFMKKIKKLIKTYRTFSRTAFDSKKRMNDDGKRKKYSCRAAIDSPTTGTELPSETASISEPAGRVGHRSGRSNVRKITDIDENDERATLLPTGNQTRVIFYFYINPRMLLLRSSCNITRIFDERVDEIFFAFDLLLN